MRTSEDVAPSIDLESMSVSERRLLLYLEARAVDRGGLIEDQNMNAEDFLVARRWAEQGLIRFSRIPSRLLPVDGSPNCFHVVQLTDAAWRLAGEERMRRAMRTQREDIVQTMLARRAARPFTTSSIHARWSRGPRVFAARDPWRGRQPRDDRRPFGYPSHSRSNDPPGTRIESGTHSIMPWENLQNSDRECWEKAAAEIATPLRWTIQTLLAERDRQICRTIEMCAIGAELRGHADFAEAIRGFEGLRPAAGALPAEKEQA